MALRVLTNQQQFRELETWYRDKAKIEDFVSKDNEFKSSAASSVKDLVNTPGWRILEAYITNSLQQAALDNFFAFEENAKAEKQDDGVVLRQTFNAGIIRGMSSVLNFPAFVEGHFKLNNEKMKDDEDEQ